MLAICVVAWLGQVAVGQSPVADAEAQTGVIVSRRIGADRPYAMKLAERAAKALTEAKVPQRGKPGALVSDLRGTGITDSARCNDNAKCLAKLARNLKLEYVVALAITQIRRDVALSVSAVDKAGETLLRHDFVFSK